MFKKYIKKLIHEMLAFYLAQQRKELEEKFQKEMERFQRRIEELENNGMQ